MTNQVGTDIIIVNASLLVAGLPNTLQQRVAFVSTGGTNLPSGSFATIGNSSSDLSNYVLSAVSISSAVVSSNTMTITTSSPHGFASGTSQLVNISGMTPANMNGTFTATITGSATMTIPLAIANVTASINGLVQSQSALELTQMANTYFTRGGPIVSIVELGNASISQSIANLGNYISSVLGTENQNYIYVVPREFDNQQTFIQLANQYSQPNSFVYFFVTTTAGTCSAYSGIKSVVSLVESPSIGSNEFSIASFAARIASQNPGSNSPSLPSVYSNMPGTTPWASSNNSTTFQVISNANSNYIASAMSYGLNQSILKFGKTGDGKQFSFWYSADWVQIQSKYNVGQAVINGANNAQNPLWYDQGGINRLGEIIYTTLANGISANLGLGNITKSKLSASDFNNALSNGTFSGKIVVNMEPFASYTQENPTDYANGIYAGASIIWIPLNSFVQVVINLVVTDLIAN